MRINIIQTNTKEYEHMINLRMRVLLDPIGIPRSYIDPEKEAADILIGAFEEDELIGCCILTHLDNDTLQLRQMAVDNIRQKKGIGASIVHYAEKLARGKGYSTLIMNARDTVIEFYKKCGYKIDGEPFSEVGIGHHKMKKQFI
jgi:N-acetylglutamate synthase-like GNAT family acetyltransferase